MIMLEHCFSDIFLRTIYVLKDSCSIKSSHTLFWRSLTLFEIAFKKSICFQTGSQPRFSIGRKKEDWKNKCQ